MKEVTITIKRDDVYEEVAKTTAYTGSRLDEDGYRKAVAKMISNIRSMGLNTVILQIRPYGDSFYESDVYDFFN